MHSFHGKKHNYFFNGDFSGEIHIVNQKTGETTIVEAEDILNLVAEHYVKPNIISKIEDMDYKDLLKGQKLR